MFFLFIFSVNKTSKLFAHIIYFFNLYYEKKFNENLRFNHQINLSIRKSLVDSYIIPKIGEDHFFWSFTKEKRRGKRAYFAVRQIWQGRFLFPLVGRNEKEIMLILKQDITVKCRFVQIKRATSVKRTWIFNDHFLCNMTSSNKQSTTNNINSSSKN